MFTMKRQLLACCMACVATLAYAQEQFDGMFQCEALQAAMVMNLSEKNVPLKDFEGENTYGYVKGNLNGTWVILKVKEIKERKAVVRMVSDTGYDAQDVELRLTDRGDVEFRLLGDQVMKTIENGRQVKMPKMSLFKKNE